MNVSWNVKILKEETRSRIMYKKVKKKHKDTVKDWCRFSLSGCDNPRWVNRRQPD